jgi:hypothetical protein
MKCIEVETLSKPVYGDSRGRDRMVVGFTTTYAFQIEESTHLFY